MVRGSESFFYAIRNKLSIMSFAQIDIIRFPIASSSLLI